MIFDSAEQSKQLNRMEGQKKNKRYTKSLTANQSLNTYKKAASTPSTKNTQIKLQHKILVGECTNLLYKKSQESTGCKSINKIYRKQKAYHVSSTNDTLSQQAAAGHSIVSQIGSIRIEFQKQNERLKSFIRLYTAHTSQQTELQIRNKESLSTKIFQQTSMLNLMNTVKLCR